MNMKSKMKEIIKPKTALLKNVFTVILAALMLVSIVTVPELPQVEAASEGEYQRISVNEGRVKIGGYYYWAEEKISWKGYEDATSASFKIMRSKTEKGKGTVIYKTGGTCTWKGEYETLQAANYLYDDSPSNTPSNGLGVFSNGTYVVFGECSSKTEKVTYWRIGVNGKGKTKLAEDLIPYFHPASASKFSGSGLMGVYKNEIYYISPPKKSKDGSWHTDKNFVYKLDMKTKKKTRVKKLEDSFRGVFDGRYIYLNGKAYDCKTGKLNKFTGEIRDTIYGMDGKLYIEKISENKGIVKICSVKNNKIKVVMRVNVLKTLDLKGEYLKDATVGAADAKYIYLEIATAEDEEDECSDYYYSYYRYNRKKGTFKKITEKQYDNIRFR